MLIQNTSNMAQAPQPARLASDSAPNVVVATPSNVGANPSAKVELPQIAVPQVAEQESSPEQLKSVLDNINRTLRQSNRNLEFSIDETTKRNMVKVVDTETGDVIRQFPSEEALAISRSIDQFQQGLLLQQKA
jgi:flagellar protein FlaG